MRGVCFELSVTVPTYLRRDDRILEGREREMDARTQAWLDQEDARIAGIIRSHGWAITYVGGGACGRPGCECPPDEGPPFAYTTGLFGLAHPELVIVGVEPLTAQGVLNHLGERVRVGEPLMPGVLISFQQWSHQVIPEEVPNPGEIVFEANRFYQRSPDDSVPVLQLGYDDFEGRFPWDPGYAAPEMQLRPGTWRA
jgi:hypothetical protein